VARGQREGFLRPYSRLSRQEPLLFLASSPSVVLTKLGGPYCRPHYSLENLIVPGIVSGLLDV
jgi:hypothetical protein